MGCSGCHFYNRTHRDTWQERVCPTCFMFRKCLLVRGLCPLTHISLSTLNLLLFHSYPASTKSARPCLESRISSRDPQGSLNLTRWFQETLGVRWADRVDFEALPNNLTRCERSIACTSALTTHTDTDELQAFRKALTKEPALSQASQPRLCNCQIRRKHVPKHKTGEEQC